MDVEVQPNRKDDQTRDVSDVNQSRNANVNRVRMVRLSRWFVRHQKNDRWDYKSHKCFACGDHGVASSCVYMSHHGGGHF